MKEPSVRAEELLPMWVVYDHPPDAPQHFVVRRHVNYSDGTTMIDRVAVYANTLAEARAAIPEGMVNVGRQPGDVPVILEVWI